MKLIKQTEMPLLSRKRVEFEIEHFNSATPSRTKIKANIAKQLKIKENLVAIRHIFPKYGKGISKVISHIYKSEDQKNKLDPMKKKEIEHLKKIAEEKKKAAEEKTKETEKKVQEAPKQEVKKEEPKQE